jgi:anaerobic selenocysteine-containing dehydrogenase
LDADLIVEAARFYAKAKPGNIQWGLAIDMAKVGTPSAHAIICLKAITGNIDAPGAACQVVGGSVQGLATDADAIEGRQAFLNNQVITIND